MKTIRTAILDELYKHIVHNLGSQESVGIDPETGKALHVEWVAAKRDEGRIIVKVAALSSLDDRVVMRELAVTVEKT